MKLKPVTKERLLLAGKVLLLLIFALSFPQQPLYSSNQNTYFAHGLASAGMRYLDLDWLAHTADPFPVFSALVDLTVRFLGEKAFYFFFIAILALFGYGIFGIAGDIFDFGREGAGFLTYFVLITTVDSGLLLRLLSKLPGLGSIVPVLEPNGLLVRGVAQQSILGGVFQPSVFGVFLVLSILFFLRERPFIAVACLVVAATFHSSYLLSAAVLTGTYMLVIIFKDKDRRKALALGATSLLLIIPSALYVFLNFRPTTAGIFAQSQSILVDFRIPHHAVVSSWFGASAVFQMIVVAAAIYLVRRTRIFPVLLAAFLTSILLTILQVLTGNKSLALLFPWRISTFLVPIASALVLAKMVSIVFQKLNDRPSRLARPIQTVLFVGIVVLGYMGARQTIALLDTPRAGLTASARFIAGAYQPGDLYLVPPDMEYIRLAAKVPILADYKSNPYKDTDVVEWFSRLKIANDFYTASGDTACNILDNISDKYGITGVVLKGGSSITKCGMVHEVYEDADFSIFAINSDEARTDRATR